MIFGHNFVLIGLVGMKDYFLFWYDLPDIIPNELKLKIIEYTFDPLKDPW